MKTRKLIAAIMLLGVLIAATIGHGQPSMINLQGKLTDPQGEPLDTTVSIQFSIFGEASDGVALWTEKHNTVVVTDGLFSVLLGSVNPIPSSVFNGDDRWLGLQVGSDDEMIPRQQIASVGYAFMAGQSKQQDGDWDYWTHSPNMFSIPDGNIGLGTDNPLAKLDVITTDASTGLKVEVSGFGPRSGWAAYFENATTGELPGCGIKAVGHPGVYGETDASDYTTIAGVYGVAHDAANYGIHGENTAGGFAGYFDGKVYISDNLGIGTEYPDKLLHIVNKDGGYNSLGIRLDPHGADFFGGTIWDIDNNGDFKIVESRPLPGYPQTRFIISDSNVGIGTTTPLRDFHVEGETYVKDAIGILTTVDYPGETALQIGSIVDPDQCKNSPVASIRESGGACGGLYVYADGSWSGYFGGGNFIVDGGNVGIGTTTPDAKLHLWKNVSPSGATTIRLNALAAHSADVKIEAFGTNIISGCGQFRISLNDEVGLRMLDIGGDERVIIGAGTAGLPGPPNKLAVDGAMAIGTDYLDDTAPKDGLLIQGSVGIGTTQPGEKLDIDGNLRLTEEGDTRKIYIGKSNGVDEPGRDLEIYAGDCNATSIETMRGGDLRLHGGRGYWPTGGDVYIYGGDTGSHTLNLGNVILAHNGTDAGGKVGLGTTSPENKLHVTGAINLDPITAPGSPSTGFVLYVDQTDGKLKAKASTGAVTVLADP